MNLVKKPAFEQWLRELARDRRPLQQKYLQEIRGRIIPALEMDPAMVVEKVHYTTQLGKTMAVTATWVGLDGTHKAIMNSLEENWNEGILQAEREAMIFDETSEFLTMQFVAEYPNLRYVAGTLQVRV